MKRLAVSLVLAVTTISGTALVNAAPAEARINAPYLSSGSTGSGVWCVQRILNRWFGEKVLVEDSQYGPRTADAVTYFQVVRGIGVDGVVGPQTGNHLLAVITDDAYCYRFLPTTY
ncbi:peptidoglycan-binding domain-containing protein [Plantactinospora sonchi]|uniref:Peptidoglycan-binding domain-containing protein n=1 Tax=Plantactinospora sonchi TaxID=1544735 RepID=A0ABU7RN12_9ACTN